MSPLVKLSHKLSPLFNRFSTFDKNVNLSKTNPEAEKFFLAFPSLNTSIFTTYLKIARTLRPFRKAWLKKSIPKMKKFSNFFHNGEQIFLPNKSREKDNLIKTYSNLLKIRFRKRTHVFDNTMTSPRKLFREKDSVIVIKTRKSHHMTKFLIICNNPRIASTKTQSKFLQYHVFCERRKFRKRRTSHDIKIEILEFSWNKNSFQKLINLWKQPKGHKISKIVKKEVTGH